MRNRTGVFPHVWYWGEIWAERFAARRRVARSGIVRCMDVVLHCTAVWLGRVVRERGRALASVFSF
jgi:hypothetical protein